MTDSTEETIDSPTDRPRICYNNVLNPVDGTISNSNGMVSLGENENSPLDEGEHDPSIQSPSTSTSNTNGAVGGGAMENEEDMGGPVFTTPVYRQRYYSVVEILRNERVKSVVDFGIAECKMLSQYRVSPDLEKAVGVDIDRNLLEMSHYLTKPLTSDYIAKRDKPLWMALYEGSVVDYDHRLADFEAVVMIELIEHLEADVLAKVPRAVFGQLNPKLAIVTTPNSEFNVLFPNFTGMRHWDHKFEWSREQFQDWCEDICRNYLYTAEYSGIGEGPEGTEHVGCCSQMAVFHRIAESPHRNPAGDHQPYHLVTECHHPYKQNNIPREDQIVQEAVYYMQMIAHHKQLDREQFEDVEEELTSSWDEEDCEVVINLHELLNYERLRKLCQDVDQLGAALRKADYQLTPDGSYVVFHHGLGHRSSSGLSSYSAEEEDEDDDLLLPCDNQNEAEDNPSQTDDSYAHEENWDEDWDDQASGNQECAGNQQTWGDDNDIQNGAAVDDDDAGQQHKRDTSYDDAVQQRSKHCPNVMCGTDTVHSSNLTRTKAGNLLEMNNGAESYCVVKQGCENEREPNRTTMSLNCTAGLSDISGAVESLSLVHSDSDVSAPKDTERNVDISKSESCDPNLPPKVPCPAETRLAPLGESAPTAEVAPPCEPVDKTLCTRYAGMTNVYGTALYRPYHWGNTSQRALNDELCDLDTSSTVSGQFSDIEDELCS